MTTYNASIAYITGKTVTAQPLLAGAAVGSPISCVSFASDSSVYGVSLIGVSTCDQILFYASGVTPSIGGCPINWNGTKDITLSVVDADVLAISGGSGSGPLTLTVTVKDTSNNLLNNINVYIVSNGNSIANGPTVSGVVALNCSAGTYTIVAMPQGQLFNPNTSGPTTFSTSQAVAIALTPITITPPSPGYATCWAQTFDTSGTTLEPNVAFTYQMAALPSGSTGSVIDSTVKSITSDGSGMLTIANIMPLASFYLTNVSTGTTLPFTAGAINTTTPINGGIV